MGVRTDEVEVELMGMDFGEKVSAAHKVFQIEERVLFEAMNGFHVALVGVRGGRDAHMLAVPESFGKVALELSTIVRLPDQIAERDTVTVYLLLNAGSEHGAGRGAAARKPITTGRYGRRGRCTE